MNSTYLERIPCCCSWGLSGFQFKDTLESRPRRSESTTSCASVGAEETRTSNFRAEATTLRNKKRESQL